GGNVYDGVPETVRQAGMLGYEVVIPTDCIGYGHLEGREPSPSQATIVTSIDVLAALRDAKGQPSDSPVPGNALVLVDIQNDFYHPDGFHGRQARKRGELRSDEWRQTFVESNVRMLEGCHETATPVIFIGTHARPDSYDRAWSKSIRRNTPVLGETYLPI